MLEKQQPGWCLPTSSSLLAPSHPARRAAAQTPTVPMDKVCRRPERRRGAAAAACTLCDFQSCQIVALITQDCLSYSGISRGCPGLDITWVIGDNWPQITRHFSLWGILHKSACSLNYTVNKTLQSSEKVEDHARDGRKISASLIYDLQQKSKEGKGNDAKAFSRYPPPSCIMHSH